ncbi:MAG: Asp-tRNA(Asn)/Glu-tRNA(Gln) amidotransferase subunit GatC [Chloroflexi bacterium]|nr:Asp-tRNA(Asn)/Glu-tRNA(Gln) amidotransferase subunit GatC [Chloroflexota bacterium]
MKLSLAEVEHLAELAKLGLAPEEKATLQHQLSAILAYADKLQELDTATIPPTATVLPVQSVLRPDDPRPSTPREEILRQAPQAEEGCFRVWTILEE